MTALAYPLSAAQRRLWLLHQLDPTGHRHSSVRSFIVDGPLNVAALQKAVRQLVERHEALRTSFEERDQGPVQRIRSTADCEILLVDEEPQREPYDLERDPLLRVWLRRTDRSIHELTVAMHLLAADGWSQDVLLDELGQLYAAAVAGEPSALPFPRIQYIDWAAWDSARMNGTLRRRLVEWWRDHLVDVPLLLQTGLPRRQDGASSRVGTVLAPEELAAVHALARREQRTVFAVLLAALGVVLHWWLGHDRLLIGLATANRDHPDVEHTLGFFVDTVALRLDFAGDPCWEELLRRVAEETMTAYGHSGLPFDELVAELEAPHDGSRSPVVQLNFAYHPSGTLGRLTLQGCLVRERPSSDPSKFELTVRVEEDDAGQCRLWAEFDDGHWDQATVRRMLRHYQEVLHHVTVQPQARMSTMGADDIEVRTICAAFALVLDVPSVAPYESFWRLGGTSMQLLRLHRLLHDRLDLHVSLGTLYEMPTPIAVSSWLVPHWIEHPQSAHSDVIQRAVRAFDDGGRRPAR